eukprot:m.204424 g.204424  ORF g.204424 m.204424 type:complete len:270 (+) comp15527_c1_seq1:1346-2155(+)
MAKSKKAEKAKKAWLGTFSKHVAKNLSAVPPPPKKKDAGVQKTKDTVSKKEKKKILEKKKKTIPYKASQSILVIGDGNFSWSAALCEKLEGGAKVIATCFDSEKDLKFKYEDAQENIDRILASGGMVLHGIDGTSLHTNAALEPCDVIVFNFPHCGFGIKDQARNIAANQELITKFLTSALGKLQLEGEIHITVKRGKPYDSWGLVKLGTAVPGMRLKNSFDFYPEAYPGYEHRRTLGFLEGVSSEPNADLGAGCKTYVFARKKGATEV